ncbi:MAG: sulfotransferase [Cyanobacteria bacterium J06632_22]
MPHSVKTAYPKLFVVGCPRSGTSWVTSLVGGHPDVVSIPIETHAYRLIYEPFLSLSQQSLQQRCKAWKGILRRYGPKPLLLGFEAKDIWRGILRDYDILNRPTSHGLHALANRETFRTLLQSAQASSDSVINQAENFIAYLLDHFYEQQGYPGMTLLEKTPLHLRYVEPMLRRFPEARVIEVIRDGRDVCVSYNALAKTQTWARIGTAGAIRQWRRCIEWGEAHRSQPDLTARILPVRYEQLKAHPTEQLAHIFDFAGLHWHPQQLQHIVQAHDIERIRYRGEGQYVRQGRVGSWRQAMSTADQQLCTTLAGQQLTQLGYMAAPLPSPIRTVTSPGHSMSQLQGLPRSDR